jgi:hypothetical protein
VKLSLSTAMRARDVSRPHPEDVTEAVDEPEPPTAAGRQEDGSA